MSSRDILSIIQQKIKNLSLQPKAYKEIFNQFFTDEFQAKIKQVIANPKELLLPIEQLKNVNGVGSNLPTAKEDKEVVQEEFEDNIDKQEKLSNQKVMQNIGSAQEMTGFICFLKGLFYETGYINNNQEEQAKAIQSYREGISLQIDSLCAFRLAEIYSSAKLAQKFGLKANQEIAYGYLMIADAYLDVQYNNNLFNISKEVEQIAPNFADQHSFAIQNIKKHANVLFDSLSEIKVQSEIDQIDTFLTFKHSLQKDSQEQYNLMTNNLGRKDDAHSLLFLIKILSNQTHNSNKQVKKIVEMCRVSSVSSINQALQWILSDSIVLSVLERDHEVFNCTRNTFIEMFNLLKIISMETQLLVPYQPLDTNNQVEYNPIHTKLYQICHLLFTKKQIFKNQLHNVLVIRIKTEILRKGIGTQQNLEEALNTIEDEKELKKGQPSLYAFYHYKKGKLLSKLNRSEEEIQTQFNQAETYFLERLQSLDLTTQVLAQYYLGQIYSQSVEQQRKAHQQFIQAVSDYKNNVDKFNQVKTFQFELLERKSQKKLESFDLSKLIESRMSRQSTQNKINFDDGITLQLKVDLVSKESGFVFFDSSVFEIEEFIAKGEIGSTSVGKIKYNLLDEFQNNIIGRSDTLAQPHTHYMTGQPRESKLKERVIIKQIPFNKNNYFDRIFHHLSKIQKVNSHEGLLKYKGFCVNQINDIAFELWIVYPKLDYNLYALIKQNILDTPSKKISFAFQLAESLNNLHNNNSYHGNIKPSNILMDNQKKAYFNDWEFSSKMYHKERVIKSSKNKTKKDDNNSESPNIDDDDSIDKNPLYSDGYIAPEIFKNPQSGQFTGSISDIWGLGMIYYFLFTGKDPSFCGLIQEQQLYNNNDLKIQRQLLPNQIISELIENMVRNDPQKRIPIMKVRETLLNECNSEKTQRKEIQINLNQTPNEIKC